MKEIKQAYLNNAYTEIANCNSVDDVYESLGAKNSDFLFFNQFFVCEGSVEKILIPHFYKLFYKKTLQEAGIQAVDLGGESNWQANKVIFEDIMRDFRKPTDVVNYFLDQDTNLIADNVCLSGTFDIEDSISDATWIAVIQESCGITLAANDMQELRAQLANNTEHKLYKLLAAKIAQTAGRTNFFE